MDKSHVIKMDKNDIKILSAIEADARTPINHIARAARVSRTVAEYRLKQFVKKGLVRGYYCLLDPSKFGLTVWKLWLSLHKATPEKKKELFAYIETHPRIWWYAQCAGSYDAVLCVLAKDPHEFNTFYNEFTDTYGTIISDSAILINVSFEYHTRGYLLKQESRLIESSFQETPLTMKISEEAMSILRILSANCRASFSDIAKKTDKNIKTISKHIRQLKEAGVIVYNRPSIDITRLGYEYYKVLLYLHNPKGGILPSIVHWCRLHPNIMATISCVGPWQLELEIEIDSFRNLCTLLTDLKDTFPGTIKRYETLLITNEGNYELDLIDKVLRLS
ncbi:MAG: Lrp/AsnC family transcriptional regulator [archaeon]